MGLPLSIGLRNFAAASDGVRVFLAGGYNSSTIAVKTAQIYVDTFQLAGTVSQARGR